MCTFAVFTLTQSVNGLSILEMRLHPGCGIEALLMAQLEALLEAQLEAQLEALLEAQLEALLKAQLEVLLKA